MKRVFFISFFLSGLFYAGAQVTQMNNEEVIAFERQLNEVSASTKSIQCLFMLEKMMALTEKPVESSGRFYYAAPDKVRWEETKPKEYLLIVSGGNIFTSNEAVAKNARHLQGIKDLMLGSANGELMKSAEFEKSYFKTHNASIVKLRPVAGMLKKLFLNIELIFDAQNLRLQSIRLNEQEGDYALIRFFEAQFDKPLDASLFTAIKKTE